MDMIGYGKKREDGVVASKYDTIEDVEIGDIVSYAYMINLEVIGFDEKHIILQDKKGNERKIYKTLFMAHTR